MGVGSWGSDPSGTSSLKTGAGSEAAPYHRAVLLWGPSCPQSYVGRGRDQSLSTQSHPTLWQIHVQQLPQARCDAPGVPGTGITLPLMKATPWSPAFLPPPQCQVSDMTKQRFTSSEFRITNPENEAGEGKVRLRVPVSAVMAPDGGVGVPDSTGLTAASCSCPLPQALGAWSASALR